jgi:nitroreductase
MAWTSMRPGPWRAAAADLRRPFDPAAGPGELVRYATLAANSHNTQPWRFAVGEGTISITPDLARRTPVVDPDDHHVFVSLGCAAENLVQAAPLAGLHATPRFLDEGGIAIDLAPGATAATPLAEAIPLRQCSRSLYDGRPVPPADLEARAAAGHGDGVEVILITERDALDSALAFMVEGNTRQIVDPAFVAELKRGLRFSYGQALATGDGLFAATSGNPVLPGPIGALMFGVVIDPASENRKLEAQLRSSAGIAVFVSDAVDRRHWIETGRCCQRFALQATALGIRHAFVNQPVEVGDVRPRFAAHLGIGDRRPDLVLRFGYGPEMPPSLRRPAADVAA